MDFISQTYKVHEMIKFSFQNFLLINNSLQLIIRAALTREYLEAVSSWTVMTICVIAMMVTMVTFASVSVTINLY